jgi:hypothetical protein
MIPEKFIHTNYCGWKISGHSILSTIQRLQTNMYVRAFGHQRAAKFPVLKPPNIYMFGDVWEQVFYSRLKVKKYCNYFELVIIGTYASVFRPTKFCRDWWLGLAGTGGSVLPGLVAQSCNPSYWEARTWDGLRWPGPQHRVSQQIQVRILGLQRLAKTNTARPCSQYCILFEIKP